MIRQAMLWLRWRLRARRPTVTAVPGSTRDGVRRGVDRCEVAYINLDRRTDRREAIEAEWARLGVTHARRLAAVEATDGAAGCAASHLAALERWTPDVAELLMVCEDDAHFLIDRATLDAMLESFADDPSLDVLCLGFNAAHEVPISATFSLTADTQTTSCYVIKPRMRAPFLAMARASAASFAGGRRGVPIDRAWKALQRRWCFAIPRIRAVRQRPSFSDVEGRVVDYRM